MAARTPIRSTVLDLGGIRAVQVGATYVPPPPPPSGSDDDLAVSRLTTNTTLSASGIYIVNSAGGVRTITLPLISAAPSDGWSFRIKREGANYVDVTRGGTNEIEPGGITSIRLFTNFSAVTLVADPAGNFWYQLGYYGAIT